VVDGGRGANVDSPGVGDGDDLPVLADAGQTSGMNGAAGEAVHAVGTCVHDGAVRHRDGTD